MNEYIYKQNVLDYLNGYLHSLSGDSLFDRGERRALINVIQDISAAKAADVKPVKELQKLHMCVAEIFRQAKRIEMFADNWDTRDPCSPDYKFIITAVNLIQAFDKEIHDKLFPEMIAEYKKEDK